MRLDIRVRPGASRTAVSGRYGEKDVLCVAVSQRAVDGAATQAALVAIADAFGLPRTAVRLVHGVRSRTKVVEIDGPLAALTARAAELLGPP